MLAMNPTLARDIVLAEKPAITTDSDRMDRGALDQLLLHTGTLGSIYHKNPEVSMDLVLLAQKYLSLNQTFIRNATGRALVDTPALNPTSRAVLVPLSLPHLPPTTVTVSGPGPVEPAPTLPAGMPKPEPPVPIAGEQDLLDVDDATMEAASPNSGEDGEPDVDGEDGVGGRAGDPYANLDGAFGGYLADKPQPIGGSRGRNADLDDLLF